jgi:subtilisin family serine protease
MRYAFAYLLFLFSCLLSMNAGSAVVSQQQEFTSTARLRHLVNDLNRTTYTANNEVTVILETSDLNDLRRKQITSHGAVFRYRSGNRHEIKTTAKKLQQLMLNLPQNMHLRLPYPHQAVAVTSEGVGISGANDMQALGNDGEGVKIGIIDMGFASYTNAQASGDLPAGLSIIDYTGTGTGGINHGTNVAEIVYDMAPGAELYLAKVNTTLQLEQAANDMLAAGVKIINHSVAWFGAAFYDGTGPICDITNTAQAAGIHWVNAMGNSRNAHYLGTFSDIDGDLKHEFSAGNNSNTINLSNGATYSLILNWDDYPTTNIDYNLYLYNGDPTAGGSLVASSTTRQNGRNSSYPYEAITYTAATTATHYIVISKGNGDSEVPLTLFSTASSFGIRTTASSVVQPADCNSVISVGAVNLLDGAEYFSSEGPTTDGRNKPEISAPNRTRTSLTSSFAGTSGASPHAAGAAALLLSQFPEFTTADLRTRLIADSQDVSSAGFDYRTGNGRISMDADDDSINHDSDNCVLLSNTDQLNTDLDTQGNVCDDDDDNDFLTDIFELSIGTSTLLVDTDGDNLSDYFEVAFDGDASSYILGLDLNPLLMDSDDDGLSDIFEISFDGDASSYVFGLDLNPLLIDSDGDTLSDYEELAWDGDVTSYTVGSDLNPLSSDTDGDSFADNSDPIPLDFNYSDGDVAPLGSPDGIVNVADYVIFQRILQQNLMPSVNEITHGDIYPVGAPDGVIDLSDYLQLKNMLLQ